MSDKKKLNIIESFAQALQNHKKNNLQVAENIYKEILKTNPDHFQSIYSLGALFLQIKKFDLAKPLVQKAIKMDPNQAMHHNNLGVTFKELGEYQNAISCYEKAIKIDPNHIKAYNFIGVIYYELGKYQKAISCYEKAIKVDPDFIGSINNLSSIFKSIKLDNLIKTNNTSLKKLFLFLFRKNNINHTEIFHNAKLFLFIEGKDNQVRKIINSEILLLTNTVIKSLYNEELFLLILQKSLIVDKFLEKLLTKLRYEMLFTLEGSNKNILKEYFDFSISLAEQCWFNEYVYAQSEKEINYINKLKSKIENNKEINELEIAILGCYIPLHTSKIITNKLLDYKSTNILFNDLITIQIKEPLKEIELLNSIKSLGKIIDPVSKKVREQYEENPYPRWRYGHKHLPYNFLYDLKNEIKPHKIEYSNKFTNPNVLIAGCGTGNHTNYAPKYKNANILGVDLSLTSLAYAKRKTEELGYKNIEYLHADILQLKNLNKKFDVIESIGTLHHMKDPIAGLQILQDILEPHGFLKLGLYSEIARDYVIKARKFIKKKNFKSTIKDIRNCRELIFNEKDDLLLQKIIHRSDFYSTSNVRDLLFHVQEHRFTIPEISEILKNLNLEFLGFIDPLIKTKFLKFFSKEKIISLNDWNQFEINNPAAFIGMYQFCVKKI